MTTTFTFVAVTGTLGVLRFHQYLDEDVEGAGDDAFFTRGSAAGSDLQLFTVDNDEVFGVSHGGSYIGSQGLGGATFAGWAADEYSDLRSELFGAGATVSLTGTIDTADLPPFTHPVVGPAYGPEDITSTLAWDFDPAATTATIVTTLGGVPEAPPPEGGGPVAPAIPTLSGLGLLALSSLVALFALRRLRA
jgi:exosortase sorting signal-containing protein